MILIYYFSPDPPRYLSNLMVREGTRTSLWIPPIES